MLEVGTMAPDFALPDQNGTIRRLLDFRGQKVVLYFYPKDMTAGCTKQACSFRDLYPQFREKGAVVLGVSRDTVASHKKFEEAHIADPYFYEEEQEEHRETEEDKHVEEAEEENEPLKEYVFTRDKQLMAVAEERAVYRTDPVEEEEQRAAYVAGILTDMEDEFIKKKRKGMTFIGKKQKAAFR